MALSVKLIQCVVLVAVLGSSFEVLGQSEVIAETVKAVSTCMTEVGNSPEAYRLTILGILGDGQPTIQQMTNDAYASAEDSGIVMMYLKRVDACNAPLHVPPDAQVVKVRKIFLGFANGLFTYGETVMMMARVRQQMWEGARAMKRCMDAARNVDELNKCAAAPPAH